jgi:Dyp-type peroxidase family
VAQSIPAGRDSSGEPELAVHEIQGNVLVGFNKRHQAVVCLKLADGAEAVREFKRWLSAFRSQVTYTDEVLKVRTAISQNCAAVQPPYSRRGQRPVGDPEEEGPWVVDGVDKTWRQIAFSARCLTRLDPASSFRDRAFREGLAAHSAELGDPQDADRGPRQWRIGGLDPDKRADVFLLIANDDRGAVKGEIDAIRTSLASHSPPAAIVYKEIGEGLGDKTPEHFGYAADGASQPGILGRVSGVPNGVLTPSRNAADPDHQGWPGQELLWPGCFVFGYVDQLTSRFPGVDPQAPQPLDGIGPEWARNGSYLVFRRFFQDVHAFHRFLRTEADRLNIDPEYLAAKLMGRWRQNGAPIVRAPVVGDRQPTTPCTINHFSYQSEAPALNGAWGCTDVDPDHKAFGAPEFFDPALADQAGRACPFTAHIRKMYPRDDFQPGDPHRRRQGIERRRLLRRALRYGEPSESTPEEPRPDDGDRGLLFISYQASIVEQFEWTVRSLANRPDYGGFPEQEELRGWDPIIGQNGDPPGDRARRFPITFENASGEPQTDLMRAGNKDEWVIPTGGEYFFVPSRTGLDHLCEPAGP